MLTTQSLLPAFTVDDLDDARRVVKELLRLLPHVGVVVTDADLRVHVMTGDVYARHDINADAAIGRLVCDVFAPQAWTVAKPAWTGALTGTAATLDWASRDGTADYWLHFAPIQTHDGAIIGTTLIAQDVTERTRGRQQFERQAIQQTAIATLGKMALHGVPPDELMQEAAAIVKATLGADIAAVLPYLETGGLDVRGVSGDGTPFPPRIRAPGASGLVMDHMRDADEPLLIDDLRVGDLAAPVLQAAGMVSLAVAAIGPRAERYGLLGACSVTAGAFTHEDLDFLQAMANVLAEAAARERTEAALRRSEERFRLGFDTAPIGMTLIEPGSGRYLRVNDAYCRFLGRPAAELLTMTYRDVLHPDDAAKPGDADFGNGDLASVVTEGRYFRPDGSIVIGAINASRVIDTDGSVDVLFSQIEDVTERRAREEASRRDLEAVSWVREIHAALAEDRFVLYAQPIIALATGTVLKYELLLRMIASDGTLVAPGEFLPAAERFGVIREIDRWVVARGVELAAEGIAVGINISGTSIGDVSLIDEIDRALARTGADPSHLVFEITETALIENLDSARRLGDRLRKRGCRFALDDFGTGFAGLSSLKSLPLDYVKIDREFVRDLCANASDQHVVRAVIDLARGFGLQTTAEGVEDQATLDLLRELGVDYAQGYFIGRPAPLGDIAEIAAPGQPAPARARISR